jgi:uncharacterized membrane protein YesL
VIRSALSDYYFHSMRLVPANVVWGAGLILVLLVGFTWPPGALVILPFLALPTAGIFHLAARIVRTEPDVGSREILWPYRHALGSSLLVGSAFALVALVLATNVVVGVGRGDAVGLVLATLAGWGLVALWAGALVTWPLMVDPARAARSLPERLRLAGALLLVAPVRFGALGLIVAVVTVVSTILTAALLTVSVAFVALLACRAVYPVADRLGPALDGERS